MTPVIVEWEDACEMDATPWVSSDADFPIPALLVKQIGYLMHEDKAHVVLTSAYAEGQVGRRTQIPRGMVKSIKKIKV